MAELWLESAFVWQFNPIGETNRIDKPELQLTEKSQSHTCINAVFHFYIISISAM